MKSAILVAIGDKPVVVGEDRSGELRLLDIVDRVKNDPNAAPLAERLIATQKSIESEILSKAGYIRNPSLRSAVEILQRHFEEIQYAFELGKPDPSRRLQSFPRDMDRLLADEIRVAEAFIEKERQKADKYIQSQWKSS